VLVKALLCQVVDVKSFRHSLYLNLKNIFSMFAFSLESPNFFKNLIWEGMFLRKRFEELA
jgi:hypothetical protein